MAMQLLSVVSLSLILCTVSIVGSEASEFQVVAVLGQADFTSERANRGGSKPAANSLYYPTGLASDGEGGLWVADVHNNRVLHFQKDAENADKFYGQADFKSNSSNRGGSTPAANTLWYPIGIASDGEGGFLVADQGSHRVLHFQKDAENADKVYGQANFVSGEAHQGGSTPAANTLHTPAGIAIDGEGGFWVTDSWNHRVLHFQKDAENADKVYGQANFVSGQANRGGSPAANTLWYPIDLVSDSEGGFWVADYYNHRVVHFQKDAENADKFLGQANLVSGQADRGGSAAANTLEHPARIASDGEEGFWVADQFNHRVLHFATTQQPAVLLHQQKLKLPRRLRLQLRGTHQGVSVSSSVSC